MRTRLTNPLSGFFRIALGLTCISAAICTIQAETVWGGPNKSFTQSGATPMDVLVTGAVAIARSPGSYLYNAAVESSAADGTPTDTEWAFGTMANHKTLTYEPFSQIHSDAQAAGQHLSVYLTTHGSMILHLKNEDIYITVTFTSWARPGGTTFTYLRSTPPVPPTVNIIAPTNNAIFAEPANVTISASAFVSGGSVTNVEFFASTNSVGSKQTQPFTVIANGLGAGSYALRAVATAAGVSSTSAPVNINVVTPVETALSTPTATEDNQFVFSFSSTPGLRYEVDISSNLFNWTPVTTSVANGSTSFFTNPISGDGNYFRVGRLPNP